MRVLPVAAQPVDSLAAMGELGQRIRDAIAAADGALPFSRFMELALYEPGLGFYETDGRAGGRQGDFVTSVETGPLFAELIGEWLDRTWTDLGRPDPFHVVEAGAGVGTLWRGLNRAKPQCFPALRYVLVERSGTQRRSHDALPGSPESLAALPASAVHVVLANELLDNLVFDIVRRDAEGNESAVAVIESDSQLGFGAQESEEWLPVPVGANTWLADATAIADRVLCLDYAADDAALVARGRTGWLRTYADHGRASDPLDAPGTADITADVPLDQLDPAPVSVRSQADFLRELGIDDRVAQARKTWEERRHIGDLEAMFARSAINEAEALLDPLGLGAFSVMEWR